MRIINNIQDQLLLLQINDAIFPIGGYTQSYGLETYIQKQLVNDVVSLRQYLEQNLRGNLLYTDILAARLAYAAAIADDIDKIHELDIILSAVKPALEIRNASTKLASRFIKTITALELTFKTDIFIKYKDLIQKSICLGHYAIAYGVLCGAMNLDKDHSLVHFSYAQVSGIVNNAVKLIPLSQTVGQWLLKSMSHSLESVLQQVQDLTIAELGRATPAFELRSMQHETLYSRLYMS